MRFMKRLLVGLIACLILSGSMPLHAQDGPPLQSEDLEWALRMMKAYPTAIKLDADPHDVDISKPELAEWCAYIDDMIFVTQAEHYTRLLYNLSLVHMYFRIDAKESAINLYRACLMSGDFAAMLIDFEMYFVIET